MRFIISLPLALVTDPVLLLEVQIYDKKINIYIKRILIVKESTQKTYSLILGQCTGLLKSKLKQSSDWETSSTDYNALALIKLIFTITFKFDDPKYLLLALHQAKLSFYSM